MKVKIGISLMIGLSLLTACGVKEETTTSSSSTSASSASLNEEDYQKDLARAEDNIDQENWNTALHDLEEAAKYKNTAQVKGYRLQIRSYQKAKAQEEAGDLSTAEKLYTDVTKVKNGYAPLKDKAEKKIETCQNKKKEENEYVKEEVKTTDTQDSSIQQEESTKPSGKVYWNVQKDQQLGQYMKEWEQEMDQNYTQGDVNPNRNSIYMTASFFQDGKGFAVEGQTAPIVASADGNTQEGAYNVVAAYASTPGKDNQIRRYLFAIHQGEPVVLVNEGKEENGNILFYPTKNIPLQQEFTKLVQS